MIPMHTTTVTVTRVPRDSTRDGYDPAPDPDTIETGLRAHIGSPSGSQNITTGDRTVVRFVLSTDPADIQADDTVTDDRTGEVYRVVWARNRAALGLDHVQGAIEQVGGAS